jgi:TniQ
LNTSHRWPLHPAPVEGEALSAWLCRIADSYEMDLMDLLLYEWGKEQLIDLDVRPPDGLLETIAGRSGVDLDALRCMTMAGWMPWLFDSFDLVDDAFNCYVNQFSVLLPQKKRPMRVVPGWRAWLPRRNLNRACPMCFSESSGKPIFKLMWQFPLFISCPIHGCWLEPFIGHIGTFYGWERKGLKPRPATPAIKKMDHRTEQAFAKGQVELPARTVHAGLWFRFLRTIIDELNTPVSYWGAQSKSLRLIWERCCHPVKAGQSYWYPFELFDVSIQLQFLEATGTAINLIETKEVIAKGGLAYLFLPEPESTTYQGAHQPSRNQEPETNLGTHIKNAEEALKKCVAVARDDPEAADQLFHFILFGRRDPKVVKEVQNMLSGVGVPVEWCQIKEI